MLVKCYTNNMKSRVYDVANIDKKRKKLKIDAKPMVLLFIVMIIGIIFLSISFLFNIGIIIVISSLYLIFIIPNKLILEFDQEFLIVYDVMDKRECSLIYYEEIKSFYWDKNRQYDYLVLQLIDDSIRKIPCIKKDLVLKTLRLKVLEFYK